MQIRNHPDLEFTAALAACHYTQDRKRIARMVAFVGEWLS